MENQNPIQPTEIPISPVAPKKSNLPLIFGGILVLLLVVAGSVYAGMKIQEKKSKDISITPGSIINYNSPSPTSIATVVTERPTPTIKEINNWKIYKNPRFGYDVKYPEGFSFTTSSSTDLGETISFSGGGDNLIKLGVYNKGAGFDVGNYKPTKNILLDGIKAEVYQFPNGYCDGESCSKPFVAVVIDKNNYHYSIESYLSTDIIGITEEFLSTFKFFSSTQSDDKSQIKTIFDKKYPENKLDLFFYNKDLALLRYVFSGQLAPDTGAEAHLLVAKRVNNLWVIPETSGLKSSQYCKWLGEISDKFILENTTRDRDFWNSYDGLCVN